MANGEDPPYNRCYGCGYLRTDHNGKIPKIRYHDKDEEEPKQPYHAGYQKCQDNCHP